MCGICGAAWTGAGTPPDDDLLRRMVDRIRHRGPDDAGLHRDRHAALGFRRLSILDVAGAHQPLSNEDGTVWVAFNGEIYNYQSLRHRLEAKGHTLRTAGDTEVLVHLYEDEGPAFVSHLRGMFAFAIWDSVKKRLVLGRDRLGQKPLVYRLEPDRIFFASELKSLLALPPDQLPREVDPLAVDEYLTYGYVPHPRTILKGVYKLPPAHVAVWHEGNLSLERYWNPDWNSEVDRDPKDDVERLRATLDEAVREQMVSEVPLGAFLSGGIDSTIIVGLMQRASTQPVKTFSIGFDDPAFDETSYAEMAAKFLGTDHHSFRVEAKAWETLPGLAHHFDEPFADSSALPTWHVSQQTRQHVTVALTGDAGDELFAGYDRYRGLAMSVQLDRLSPAARRFLSGPLARAIPASSKAKTKLRSARRFLEAVGDPLEQRYLRWMTSFDETARAGVYSDTFLDRLGDAARDSPDQADPASFLARAFAAAPKRDPVTRAMIADLLTYLPGDLLVKVDIASMAHSLEARGPFLDHRVVELAMAMPLRRKLRLRRGRSKVVLKEAFADLLPPPIKTRSKMGFGVPLDRWFRGPLKDELQSVLLDPVSLGRGLFRPEAIRLMLDEHISGRRDHAYKLWALLMLELWHREYVDR